MLQKAKVIQPRKWIEQAGSQGRHVVSMILFCHHMVGLHDIIIFKLHCADPISILVPHKSWQKKSNQICDSHRKNPSFPSSYLEWQKKKNLKYIGREMKEVRGKADSEKWWPAGMDEDGKAPNCRLLITEGKCFSYFHF